MKNGWTKLFLILIGAASASAVTAGDTGVTFEFAPPRWQSAICLPDDPCKTLVDSDGVLLYHYGPQGGFHTRVRLDLGIEKPLITQRLLDPRVPIVKTERKTDEMSVAEEAFAVCDGKTLGVSRKDVLLAAVTNTSKRPQKVVPRFIAKSANGIVALEGQQIQIGGHEVLLSTHPVARVTVVGNDANQAGTMKLAPMTLAPGQTVRFALVYCGGETVDASPMTIDAVLRAREQAEGYWRKADLPYGRVTVPDAGIQGLLDSAVRNIWQAREIKKGLPAFQVGPTCYRGLWIVDGSFLLEAATMLGAGDQARAGIEYMLSFQKEDGRFEVLPKYHKENGIVLWACTRHAQLTQDPKWLESVWPKLERAAAYIQTLRKETLKNDSPLDDGLMPPGSIDGGIGRDDLYEFSNVYWNLLGLKAFVGAAHWLGKEVEAADWQREFDDFQATFQKAFQRDTRSDIHGNRFLHTLMTLEDKVLESKDAHWYLACKGQWAFCHGVYPGQLFGREDPLVTGNLAMLRSYEQEGMVTSTGWMTGGIWNYFASFYGHVWLWNGDGPKAAECLYAMANHASPLLAWREEQCLKGQEYREVGDMPHNWASAEFIRLAIHLLALDRGNELHLLEGLPAAWT